MGCNFSLLLFDYFLIWVEIWLGDIDSIYIMYIEVLGELIFFKVLYLGMNDNIRRIEDYSEMWCLVISWNVGKCGFVIAIVVNLWRNIVFGLIILICVGIVGWFVCYMLVYVDLVWVLCIVLMG